MAIRSVDMMVLYSKTVDVEKMMQMDQQQAKVGQQDLAANEIKRKDVETTKTMESKEEAESGRIAEHQERNRGGRKNRGGAEEEQQGEEKKTAAPRGTAHGGSIDITV